MSAGQAAKLSLEDVSQRFGETEALAPTDLEIGAGEFVSVVGPSAAARARCSISSPAC